MKIAANKKVTITIELTEPEAARLLGFIQNVDKDESEENKLFLSHLFRDLQAALK